MKEDGETMNFEYLQVFRFIIWLFGEIIRLGKKGTVPELDTLSEILQKAKREYINTRRRMRYKTNGKDNGV